MLRRTFDFWSHISVKKLYKLQNKTLADWERNLGWVGYRDKENFNDLAILVLFGMERRYEGRGLSLRCLRSSNLIHNHNDYKFSKSNLVDDGRMAKVSKVETVKCTSLTRRTSLTCISLSHAVPLSLTDSLQSYPLDVMSSYSMLCIFRGFIPV